MALRERAAGHDIKWGGTLSRCMAATGTGQRRRGPRRRSVAAAAPARARRGCALQRDWVAGGAQRESGVAGYWRSVCRGCLLAARREIKGGVCGAVCGQQVKKQRSVRSTGTRGRQCGVSKRASVQGVCQDHWAHAHTQLSRGEGRARPCKLLRDRLSAAQDHGGVCSAGCAWGVGQHIDRSTYWYARREPQDGARRAL